MRRLRIINESHARTHLNGTEIQNNDTRRSQYAFALYSPLTSAHDARQQQQQKKYTQI